jgi:hypothetical protein
MPMIRLTMLTGLAAAVALALPGCYYPYPAPAPAPVTVPGAPASFDASWQAARGAASDEGVRITYEDRSTGTLRGEQGQFKVLITVASQPNGSVQVAFTATGPTSNDTGLQDRLTRAYNRRMGR